MKANILNIIKENVKENTETNKKMLDSDFLEVIEDAAILLIDCLRNGNKILLCGNGGSAADSQHFAAEIIGRFEKNRKSLPAVALTTDTSNMTAIANDFGFEMVFAKQVEGLGSKNDILIGISTSGNSPNVVMAIEQAKKQGLKTLGFLGKDGGKIKGMCDVEIIAPHDRTSRIQEFHELLIHTLCNCIEKELFG